jgi:hypothetical protein
MTSENSQNKSQLVQQGTQSTLTDSDIDELISFFQLLDEWDLQHKSKSAIEKPTALEHHPEDAVHLRR